MQATDLRRGTTIIYEKELYIVTDFEHRTPGNLRAFVRATLKNLKNGRIIQNRFASTDNIERVSLDAKKCQYSYHDDQGFHFMDMESFETFALSDDMVGEQKFYLIENMEINIDFYDGKPVLPEFPKIVVLKVVESPPWVRGDSVSNALKPAVCETGLKVQVPLFIDEGNMIKISTETGEYLGRA